MRVIEKITEAVKYISSRIENSPTIGLILGSGLGVLGDEIQDAQIIPYGEIPHFPKSTVEGHAGELVIGELEGKVVVGMKGRFHYYEGYSMEMVTFPVRVMMALGVETIIVTNAAGGANKSFSAGDLMLIEDHINFAFNNPLIGPNDPELGVRFPDMSSAYDKDLIDMARSVAKRMYLDIKQGVYAYFTGPTYETPAEIRMISRLGADAVGMSTVPEVIVARHGGAKVLGISCITNMAAGILDQPLNHQEVIETAQKVTHQFVAFVKEIIKSI
ncbi:purine-nucleoside phosphorylase [Clostridium aceticum]|nr:purine-nucleoside phosphorylase [Clostridium aceticum]